jgi:hypothetical protein
MGLRFAHRVFRQLLFFCFVFLTFNTSANDIERPLIWGGVFYGIHPGYWYYKGTPHSFKNELAWR